MYPTFFGLILALVGYKAFLEDYTVRILLAWPLLSLAIMFSAYSFRKPFFVCGKKSDGSSNWALVIGNLPWLMFTWLIWFFEVSISSEDPINHIPDTNLYIGRYPRVFFPKRKFDLVIDLTAEFPRSWDNDEYLCLPNLDGISLQNIAIPFDVSKENNIYVHCAQGHGRSATFMAFLINKIYPEVTKKEAYEKIKEARAGVRASNEQIKQILA